MSITHCSECSHQISSKAAACPQCGSPIKPSILRRNIPLGKTVVLVLFGAFIYTLITGPSLRSGSPERSAKDKEFSWMEVGKDSVRQKLKDADSAKFRGVFFHRGADDLPMTCGEVNSTNSLGGYSGYQRFVSAGSVENTYLEEQVDGFSGVWNQFCQ